MGSTPESQVLGRKTLVDDLYPSADKNVTLEEYALRIAEEVGEAVENRCFSYSKERKEYRPLSPASEAFILANIGAPNVHSTAV